MATEIMAIKCDREIVKTIDNFRIFTKDSINNKKPFDVKYLIESDIARKKINNIKNEFFREVFINILSHDIYLIKCVDMFKPNIPIEHILFTNNDPNSRSLLIKKYIDNFKYFLKHDHVFEYYNKTLNEYVLYKKDIKLDNIKYEIMEKLNNYISKHIKTNKYDIYKYKGYIHNKFINVYGKIKSEVLNKYNIIKIEDENIIFKHINLNFSDMKKQFYNDTTYNYLVNMTVN